MLIAGGYFLSNLASVEVVNLASNSSGNCDHIGDLPAKIWNHVGTNMYGSPLLCGGNSDLFGIFVSRTLRLVRLTNGDI